MKGQILSHYRILELIGEGGSGVIYKAEDQSLGRLVALKCLPSDLPPNGSTVLRFQHEARTASGINHPNICTIHEIGEHEGRQFIVMEWLEGRTLADLIDRRPLKLEKLLEYAIQIADGLQAAHTQRIIHRDIKPANILITDDDQVKILDFGISLLMPTHTSNSAHGAPRFVGTAPYLSPEQVHGENLDPRSDLFSLGTVLYEMATGRRPFIAGTIEEIAQLITEHSPPPPRTLNPDLPDDVDRIVMRALETNRKLRYQTAGDLHADLLRSKRDLDSRVLRTIPKPVNIPFRGRSVERRWLQTGSAAALGILASIVVLIVMASRVTTRPPDTEPVTPAETAESRRFRRSDIELPPSKTLPAQSIPVRAVATPKAAPQPPKVNDQAVNDAVAARATVSEKVDGISEALEVARKKAEAGLHDQALETLRDVLRDTSAAPGMIDAYFLMGSIHEARGKPEDAMAVYLEIAHRFKGHERGAEALYRLADAALLSKRSDRDSQARQALAQLVADYPESPRAPDALLMKARIEETRRLYERDGELATSVPSALVSYRQLARQYPHAKGVYTALTKLAELYKDVKRFELAAAVFGELGTRYPTTSPDAWYRAAELYRRDLRAPQLAREAYAKVPPASRHFRDAQGRLR